MKKINMTATIEEKKPRVFMKGIVKRFPNVVANHEIDFRILKGEIHSVLGENGAGKTTLMNLLSGLYKPDAGDIFVDGRKVSFRSPRDALDHGIGMIHQHFQLVNNFSVAENIVLGMPGPVNLDITAISKSVDELSDRYGLAIDSRSRIWELSVGEQQRVEILRMLYRNIDILIMDEPTAVLAPQEIERLFAVMRLIKNEGRSVIFITHKLEEVLQVSDYITVLRRGKIMSTVRPEKVRKKDSNVSRELARMMVGREVILEIGKEPCRKDKPLLHVEQLSVRGDRGEPAVKDISFSINVGEIFAILGVAGNGQRELVEALVGLRAIDIGKVLLDGADISDGFERVGYIPEDRNERGSVPDMRMHENFALTGRDRFSIGPLMRWKTVADEVRQSVEDFNIAASSIDMKARQLSGGNLQKLILAREFSQQPFLLIAEQPTRGLDIGATEEIWKAILKHREKGGILIVSGDLKEVLSLADTIMVIFRGQVMDIISCKDDEGIADIGPLMAGVRRKR